MTSTTKVKGNPIIAFLDCQEASRQETLRAIHEIILKKDRTIIAEVGTMMRQEMILYKDRGVFKYGLADGKQYISLHLMPIYLKAEIHAKYKKLMSEALFQKGCINFKPSLVIPLKLVSQLIVECAKIDVIASLDEMRKKKK